MLMIQKNDSKSHKIQPYGDFKNVCVLRLGNLYSATSY